MMFQGLGGYGVGGFAGGRNHFSGGGRGGGRHDDDQTDINSEHFRKLFVGGLNYETDEKSLKSYFEQWGEIVDCVVLRDQDTNSSRGFGFITYKDSSMIDEAQKNRPHRIDNREVETKRAMPKNADGASNYQSVKKMFVGGLKDDTTEEQMRDVFGQFGEIESVDIVVNKATGKVRGFAFITYKDYDSVDRAVLLKRHDLNTRRVEVKKAVPKDQTDGSSRGGGSAGCGRGRGIDNFGCGSGGFNGLLGPFPSSIQPILDMFLLLQSGYRGGSFVGNRGGQNWGGSGSYGNHRKFVTQYKQTVTPMPNGSSNITGLPLEEENYKTELSVTNPNSGEFVTQYKQTVTPMPNGSSNITGLPLEEENYKTELSVTNPNSEHPEHMDIQEVSQEKEKEEGRTRKRKKRKQNKKKKAGSYSGVSR
ncbi:hypothetical protein BsWGS_09523 [Bradybaena similaris]